MNSGAIVTLSWYIFGSIIEFKPSIPFKLFKIKMDLHFKSEDNQMHGTVFAPIKGLRVNMK